MKSNVNAFFCNTRTQVVSDWHEEQNMRPIPMGWPLDT